MTLSRPEPTLTGGDFQCRHCRLLAGTCLSLTTTTGQKRTVLQRFSRPPCRSLGASTKPGAIQFGTLRASWGYGSTHDGERYEVHLCEPCFFRTISGLRRERMVNTMFSDKDQDLGDFGRIARDDFFKEGGGTSS